MKVQTQQKKEKSDIAVYPSGSEATTPVFHKVKHKKGEAKSVFIPPPPQHLEGVLKELPRVPPKKRLKSS